MWETGEITVNGETLTYCVKRYDNPSQYGINSGRVSKLEIRGAHNEIRVNYDRGWDMCPDSEDEEATAALAELLERFN